MISASDLPDMYKNLIGLDKIRGNSAFYQKLNNFEYGKSSCLLYLGLSKTAVLEGKNGWYYPSYDINKVLEEQKNIIDRTYETIRLKQNKNINEK